MSARIVNRVFDIKNDIEIGRLYRCKCLSESCNCDEIFTVIFLNLENNIKYIEFISTDLKSFNKINLSKLPKGIIIRNTPYTQKYILKFRIIEKLDKKIE